jgi:DNA-binding CsgD family transcriptional regulator
MEALEKFERIHATPAVASDAVRGSSLALLLDELSHGIVIATVQGRMLQLNHAARHELRRQRVLTSQNDTLEALTPESSRTLHEALAKVVDGKRSLITLTADAGAPLTIAIVPLKGEGSGESPLAALLFARDSICESLMLCFFARAHGLTSTEELVLGILSRGLSAPQIAAEMKVAVSTVRSHVRSLCAKTRSSGVRELVARVAVLPPVVGPTCYEPMH